jgi:2',3'-cyclic-nucleotide 2'-phosphodiesterase/3'-nucleotidase
VNLRHPFRLRADRHQAQLRLLATSDLHFQLMAWDYFADRPSPSTGLVRAAALIRALRAAVPNCLLFDNGDFLQGSPLSDWVADNHHRGEDGIHPMIAAMNALGYDAGTLGNHEFNFGLPFLRDAISRAAFPIVSANILTRDGHPFVMPSVLLDRMVTDAQGQSHPIRIGVIGLAPPQIVLWDRVELDGAILTRDIVDTAAAHVPGLRAAGAEIVVALAHTGIGPDTHADGMENAAVPLAAIPGVDALITGHTHQVFPGPAFTPTPAVDPVAGTLHGKPAVMPGFHGSHVGVIDLHLERAGDRWHAIGHSARVIPVAEAPLPAPGPDPLLDALATVPHRRLLADIRREIGRTDVPLCGFFSLVTPDLTLQVVADAQRARARTLLADRPEAAMPLISAVAPFHAGGRAGPQAYVDIPPGPLRRRHASELYVYPNRLCVIEVTGAQIADWLEHVAGLFCRITPGLTDQPLIDPAVPAYLFDVLDGLTYVIDPAQPSRYDAHGHLRDASASRLRDLRLEGSPLDPGQRLLVATNSYRAGGAPALAGSRLVVADERFVREAVEDYITGKHLAAPVLRRTWGFADHPETAAWFDTSPTALTRAHPAGAAPHGPAPDGFHRFTQSFDPARHRQPGPVAP